MVPFLLSDEQEHIGSHLFMMLIPLTCWTICCCGTLTFPVEQSVRNSIVLIKGCRAEFFIGFVQSNEEHICLLILYIENTLSNSCGFVISKC